MPPFFIQLFTVNCGDHDARNADVFICIALTMNMIENFQVIVISREDDVHGEM